LFFKANAGYPPGSSSSKTARLTGCGPTVLSKFHHKGPVASKFANGLSLVRGGQCWRLTAILKQSRKQSPKSRKRFRLSGAACHKDRSTRLWKNSQIKRLKACVGAWSLRWTLRAFTVTMKF